MFAATPIKQVCSEETQPLAPKGGREAATATALKQVPSKQMDGTPPIAMYGSH